MVRPLFFTVKGDDNQEVAEKSKPKLYMKVAFLASILLANCQIWAQIYQ
ncbi:Uncharacterised protein [Moraxella caviae]|uniref:Uncharacterized protein n=1 Tax=Moraxella caviae TaxID=34060 RepID=A0A378R9N3_9GAMM|nr:Uncharacterised protein [Moraxella caviae]